jgi:XTP/dITP diphosphohydrolase
MSDESRTLTFVTASANPDKVAEIAQLFAEELPNAVLLPRPIHVADVIEDADSLVGNARLKAEALVSATGIAAVSDDTGLFVEALDGEPGIFTARFAGEHATYNDNCQKLLNELVRVGAVTSEMRRARFVTVAMVCFPDGSEVFFEGSVEGVIATEMRGTNGFGYDALFVPLEANGRTFAELSDSEKNALSHRGRAFRGLAATLRLM